MREQAEARGKEIENEWRQDLLWAVGLYRQYGALQPVWMAAERYLYDSNNQREPSDQEIAEFLADNSMLGMVLLVYDLPKPGLGKPTSGAEVLKEKARLEPLVEAATQAAVDERGRTLDKD
jgi:hypothetical protein